MPKAKPPERDYKSEDASRLGQRQTKLGLTDDERADVERLAAALGTPGVPAPIKQTMLAAVRAALAVIDGEPVKQVRLALHSDLEPAKRGRKPAQEDT